MLTLLTLSLLQVKHFVFDWWLQTPVEIQHKGNFLDWKGVTHSLKHGLGTALTLGLLQLLFGVKFDPWLIVGLSSFDFLVHYIVDWSKQNIVCKMGFTPSDEGFWLLMGLDQSLHQFTYLVITYLAVL